MSNAFIKGTDSGKVSDKVKKQLFVDAVGICTEPDCNERLMQGRTTLGECAHIIPRKVGSHKREDYSTPLEDRRKEPNLIYLCLKHHHIVDDKQHEDIYTADLLREWKIIHENWAASITKSRTFIPKETQDLISSLESKIAEDTALVDNFIRLLIETCREYLRRRHTDIARAFLAQIDVLLLDYDVPNLRAEADLLGAMLTIQEERILEAKQQLRDIMSMYPDFLPAQFEYVELCHHISEQSDEAEQIENALHEQIPHHPRLQLLTISKQFGQRNIPPIDTIPEQWADDVWLNARFMCQYALIYNATRDLSQRDDLINRWQTALPYSPRPHLFRVIFRCGDIHIDFDESPKEYAEYIREALQFSQEQRRLADNKDPLSIRDQIHWLILEIQLRQSLAISLDDIERIKQLISEIITLVQKCYFDGYIDFRLVEFLSLAPIEEADWTSIIDTIRQSKVIASHAIIDRLFIQAIKFDGLDIRTTLLETYQRNDLIGMHHAIETKNAVTLAQLLNEKKETHFAFLLIQSIPDPELIDGVMGHLEVDEEQRYDAMYIHIMSLVQTKNERLALRAIEGFPLDQAGMHALHDIARVTLRNQQWRLFIPIARKLLLFPIPDPYRVFLHTELSFAYFQEGDDSNAITYAKEALSHLDDLDLKTTQSLLELMANAHLSIGEPEAASNVFSEYPTIERTFSLLLLEASVHLRTHRQDKYDKAMVLILEAFASVDDYTDDLYLMAWTLFVELDNAQHIHVHDEEMVKEGLFIKLDGFKDGWFYVGEKEHALGVNCIEKGSPDYDAVINKRVSEAIAWSSDRFSAPDTKRHILRIAKPLSYLSWRASEIMQDMADLGTGSIWKIQLINEDHSLNEDVLQRVYEELFKPHDKFFEQYVASPLPFSFLCTMEGDIARSLGRIITTQTGFIYCNKGSAEHFKTHDEYAAFVLDGQPCILGGLSAVMLTQANLLEPVLEKIPHLKVPTSVIRLLRQMADDIHTFRHSVGRAGFVDGKLVFTPQNKENDAAVRKTLLRAADILDQDAHKVIVENYTDTEQGYDNLIPDYYMDAVRWAQKHHAFLLMDDTLLMDALSLEGDTETPPQLSSISLVRAMTDHQLLDWTHYLQYFALLSHYRFKLLPISVDDLYRTVLVSSNSGLVMPQPRNLELLNLGLTLSQEYGVVDKVVIAMLAEFFLKLIQDDGIPPEIVDEIIAISIKYGLASWEKRQIATLISQVCKQKINQLQWLSNRAKQKLANLEKRLVEFANGYNPLIVESHLLLKNHNPINSLSANELEIYW